MTSYRSAETSSPRTCASTDAGRRDDLGLRDRPAVDDLEERVEQQREARGRRRRPRPRRAAPAAAPACARRRARAAAAARRAARRAWSPLGGALGRFGGRAHDGEDRALDRAHARPGTRRRPRGAAPRATSAAPTCSSGAEGVGQAPQDLGEDDARVAAGAHERAVRDRLADLGHGLRGRRAPRPPTRG